MMLTQFFFNYDVLSHMSMYEDEKHYKYVFVRIRQNIKSVKKKNLLKIN